ncbi:MAG: Rpn family recombination-promoting nuclease/putative transposase [Mangrovibacterium sp.]
MAYLDPKNDLTFKKVFGEHDNLIISLLNALLPFSEEEKILSVEYLSPELVPEIPGQRNSIVDVRCKDVNGREFIVEMQMHWISSFLNRMLANSSKIYGNQLKPNDPFSRLRPVYALGLINSTYLPHDEDCIHHYSFNNGKTNGHKIPGIEMVCVELPKFKPENFSEKKMMVLWLRFLTEIEDDSKTIPEGLDQEEELRQAIEVLEKNSYNEAEMAYYNKYWDNVSIEASIQEEGWNKGMERGLAEGVEKGLAEGVEKGLAEGVAKEKKETARKMKASGMAVELIQQFTGLSEEEINFIAI